MTENFATGCTNCWAAIGIGEPSYGGDAHLCLKCYTHVSKTAAWDALMRLIAETEKHDMADERVFEVVAQEAFRLREELNPSDGKELENDDGKDSNEHKHD